MVMELNSKRTALSLGILFAIMHTIGVIAILSGALDYIMKVHFLTKSYIILPFDLVTFVLGVATAFVMGWIVGWLFASIYNYLTKRHLFG